MVFEELSLQAINQQLHLAINLLDFERLAPQTLLLHFRHLRPVIRLWSSRSRISLVELEVEKLGKLTFIQGQDILFPLKATRLQQHLDATRRCCLS